MGETGSYPEHEGVTDNLRGSRQASWRRWRWDCVTRRDRGEGQQSRKDTRLTKALVAAPGSAELSLSASDLPQRLPSGPLLRMILSVFPRASELGTSVLNVAWVVTWRPRGGDSARVTSRDEAPGLLIPGVLPSCVGSSSARGPPWRQQAPAPSQVSG